MPAAFDGRYGADPTARSGGTGTRYGRGAAPTPAGQPGDRTPAGQPGDRTPAARRPVDQPPAGRPVDHSAAGRAVERRAEPSGATYGGSTYNGLSSPTTRIEPTGGTSATLYGTPAVPKQRTGGTVYGGAGGPSAIDMTMPVGNPLDNSGSLTGHILAQGWHDTPAKQTSSNVKVIVIMLLVMLTLVGTSVLFLFTAGDAFTEMLTSLLGK